MFNKNILCCGITGNFGKFHSKISINYGTKIVCGLNLYKNGGIIYSKPIFSSCIKSVKCCKCKISIIFIPNIYCKKLILENIFSGIKIIICITENINNFDMLKIKFFCKLYNVIFIGPNTPGIILPLNKLRLGIFPLKIIKKGILSIISRSGTLTYEAIKESNKKKLGQYLCFGIGGDIIIGIEYKNILNMFLNLKKILIIGEIGGNFEKKILYYKKKNIIFYIAGIFSPIGKKMGHAGAINNKNNDIIKKIKKIKKKFIIINSLNNLI
ncbi:succinyl-CoA synthetase subunit alpha [Candidatus Carsonella ruddii]|uniref:Succinyl-CoA synthetase alpha subunit n=1 Tax=Candidatus Carsonella ruddii CE isolate Thao2000 TaxID=1202536 RepID=J7GZZ1_CARRU|nr:succinyl-CoA synthetase subunit alpha [Candidatus Carsonella ruddii]AFP83585.1 succinyl-CoA synthetase alpha subunit [Candidatus Carsonella ruddii CE isolate Thao2000]